MTVDTSNSMELHQLFEVINNLEGQLQELKARLDLVEQSTPSTLDRITSPDADVRFLGRGFEKKTINLESTKSSDRATFLGTKYQVESANPTMIGDGTTRRFLGRKFEAKVMK